MHKSILIFLQVREK